MILLLFLFPLPCYIKISNVSLCYRQIKATIRSLSRSPVSQAPGRVNYCGSQDWKVGQAPVPSVAFPAHCRHPVIQTDPLLLTVIRTRCSWAFRGEEEQHRNWICHKNKERMQGVLYMTVHVCVWLFPNGVMISSLRPFRWAGLH